MEIKFTLTTGDNLVFTTLILVVADGGCSSPFDKLLRTTIISTSYTYLPGS